MSSVGARLAVSWTICCDSWWPCQGGTGSQRPWLLLGLS